MYLNIYWKLCYRFAAFYSLLFPEEFMIFNALYHGLSLVFLILLYYDFRGVRKQMPTGLKAVYIMATLVILTDCGWYLMEWAEYKPLPLCYAVNIIYYIAGAMGVFSWALFSVLTLGSRDKNRRLLTLLCIPAAILVVMVLFTPVTGFFFYFENGQYVRGELFALDAVVQLGYLLFSMVYAFEVAEREERRYVKKRTVLFGIFCVPVLIGGILQAVTGLDFNCVSPVIALAIVYRSGLSNESKENETLLNAIGQSYEATFIVDADSLKVRTLSVNERYSRLSAMVNAAPYDTGLAAIVHEHALPEDRSTVEHAFSMDNLLSQLKEKGVYSVIYKTETPYGQEEYNKATFLKAFSEDGHREIILGIEMLETRQMLEQQKEALENERDEFERVKESLTSVLANIIEARDIDSGEHVLRVKTITQLLCGRIMADYPEYGLTPLKVRYIVQGSALHDVGKIMIPDAVLLKPGRLTRDEFDLMKTHCVRGCEILDKLPADLDEAYISYAREICRWHHEKYDGKGYPDGLKGDEIPISAQIVSLADCFDALTSPRVYKPAFSPEEAFRMITGGECGVFNEKLMRCFEKSFDEMKNLSGEKQG